METEELRVSSYVQDRLAAIQQVVVLGRRSSATPTNGKDGRHLPIFAFLVRCGDRFLHFHFVTALLNDLFGVQSRGIATINTAGFEVANRMMNVTVTRRMYVCGTILSTTLGNR